MTAELIEALRMRRFLAAPPEAVFRAWTTPEEFKLWWRPGQWTTSAVEMDLRVGGAYRVSMGRANGALQLLAGTYLEITPARRLVLTWSLQGDEVRNPDHSVLRLEFKAQGGGTEVALLHEKLPDPSRKSYAAGWTSVLDQLERHLRPVLAQEQTP